MFDIGFWEFMMVGLIALIVVGPERLPGLARTVGLWVGKARYFVSSVKAEIDREIQADALKRMLEEHAKVPEIHELLEETHQHLTDVQDALRLPLEPSSHATPQALPAVQNSTPPSDALDTVPEALHTAEAPDKTGHP